MGFYCGLSPDQPGPAFSNVLPEALRQGSRPTEPAEILIVF
jgi:hypothetical protein